MLSYPDAGALLANVRGVVVDEWHELLGNKRGVLLQLCLARLRAIAPALRVWGLSATLGNLEQARDVLLPQSPGAAIVSAPRRQRMVLHTLLPSQGERFPWAGHLGLSQLSRVAQVLQQARRACCSPTRARRRSSGIARCSRCGWTIRRRWRCTTARSMPRCVPPPRLACATAACVAWSPHRASTWAWTFPRWTRSCRSAARRAWRACCSAAAVRATGLAKPAKCSACRRTHWNWPSTPRRAWRWRTARSSRAGRRACRWTCWRSTA